MGLKVETVVMLGCKIPRDIVEGLKNSDDFYSDIDSFSSWNRGQVTYIYDGMNGDYLYVGEALRFTSDIYRDFHFTIENSLFKNSQTIKDFCKLKFGLEEEPKIHVFNHIS